MMRLSPDVTAELGAIFQDACESDAAYRRLFLCTMAEETRRSPQRTGGPGGGGSAIPMAIGSRSPLPTQAYHHDSESKAESRDIPAVRDGLATRCSMEHCSTQVSHAGMHLDTTPGEPGSEGTGWERAKQFSPVRTTNSRRAIMSTRNSPTTAASLRSPLLTSGRSVSRRSQSALPPQEESPGCFTDADLQENPNAAGGGHHVPSGCAAALTDYLYSGYREGS